MKDFKVGIQLFSVRDEMQRDMDATLAKIKEIGYDYVEPAGYGVQNYASILESCEKIGAEYLIVEQDQWYDEDPFECAKKSREYLKNTFGI